MFKRFLPFLSWFPLTRDVLRSDLIAGATVALLAIPQSLAYAQLAGVPAHHGLYAALIPCAIGALFGSSGILSTGPVAMTSLLTAASITALALPGSGTFVSYAILLSLLSGLIQLGFGILRMGILLNFLSYPVLMGFINAAAIIIALSQLPALLGISVPLTQRLMVDTWHVLTHIRGLNLISLCFGLAALAGFVAFRRYAPRVPGVLIVVAVLTLASYLIGYETLGGRVVGAMPRGMPSFSVPSFDLAVVSALLPAAFLIALISFMEAMSSCKVIAIKTRTAWDDNRELIGQGLAKIAASFSQAIPVSGSFSRSALNLAAGAKTGMSSIFAAVLVLLTLLFFTPLLYHLPKSVLAAAIIVAVANLVDYGSISRSWRARRDDGLAAIITFVTTLVFAPNIQIGIMTGIMLSLVMLLYRLMRPRVTTLGVLADGTMRDAESLRRIGTPPRLGILYFDGSLVFVNVAYFEQALLGLERSNTELKYVLVVGSGINGIDASGTEMLNNLAARLAASGIRLAFCGVKPQVLKVMHRAGVEAMVGANNFYSTEEEALRALRPLAFGEPAMPPAAGMPLPVAGL